MSRSDDFFFLFFNLKMGLSVQRLTAGIKCVRNDNQASKPANPQQNGLNIKELKLAIIQPGPDLNLTEMQ